ncbi:MAG: magnesium transporter [Firmicutes bacterium]|nr:magnesium transporter [Bacillota bacterium]
MDEMELEQLKQTILEKLRSKNFPQLREVLDSLNPADIAEIFTDLSDDDEIKEEDVAVLFRILPKDLAADTFVEMDSDMQEGLIKSFSDKELKEVVEDIYLDDTVDIIEEMPANVVDRILRNVDSATRKSINQILNYPEDSVGSIMTIEYITLRPEFTVRDAFAHIRQVGSDKETINNCYVTSQKKLVGIVSVRDLLLADYDDTIESIMETNVISVMTLDDRETAAQMFNKYDFTAIPVVDKDDRMVGIVTIDDAIDVLTEEATEDIEKMAAITPSEHPYLKASAFETWKQRIPWLLLLMISATFTGIIISNYENALAAQVVLTAFIPMIMDTGGNSGSQASVTVIRSISLGDVDISDILTVIWKEIRVAVLCGATLAAVAFGKIMLVDRLMMGNDDITVLVAAVICLTLLFTVILAKIVGCSLPLIAKRLGFDPAVMASPFITTIVDALSLTIYMKLATMILKL